MKRHILFKNLKEFPLNFKISFIPGIEKDKTIYEIEFFEVEGILEKDLVFDLRIKLGEPWKGEENENKIFIKAYGRYRYEIKDLKLKDFLGLEKDFKISNGSVLEKKDEFEINLIEKISFPFKIQFKLNKIREIDNGISIEKFFREDGSLDLPKGKAIGSINARGFKLISAEGEEPRFEAVGKTENFLAPGDEWWDDRFNRPGTSDVVYYLLWAGQNLYVGGSFGAAGGKSSSYIALWRPCCMEVSSEASAIPLKVLKDTNSTTRYYIYFEKVYSASGYNIYEGDIGTWYSHSTGTNTCNAKFLM